MEFISQDSIAYATAVAARILQSVERLRDHPRLGRIVPEYRVDADRVGIVAIVHGSRNLLRYLEDRPWTVR